MKQIFSLLILFVASGLAEAQYRFPPVLVDDTVRAFPTYSEGHAEALRTGKPLVLFVGVPPRELAGAVTAYANDYEPTAGIKRRHGILVSLPTGYGNWFPATATDDELRAWFPERNSVKALPSPFGSSSQDRIARPDDRGSAAGPRYQAGHRCNLCGRTVTIIAGPGPTRGTHRHDCPCGNSWFH